MKKSKLAIIVPYRNREKQLNRFIKHIDSFFSDKDVDYHIFVIEQNDIKPFNQGKLLNIGFANSTKPWPNQKYGHVLSEVKLTLFRKKWTNHRCSDWYFTHFAFHDVDLLPEKDVDYSYPVMTTLYI